MQNQKQGVKTAPMYLLRSYSIVSRTSRLTWGQFYQKLHKSQWHKKQKQLWLRYAQKLYARFARLDAKASDQKKRVLEQIL